MSKDWFEKWEKWIDSPEGIAATEEWLNKREAQERVQNARFEKLVAYLENHSFDELLQRLIGEHGEEHRDFWYNKGIEPHPNNKLQFLLDYIGKHGKPLPLGSVDDNPFESELYEFKGYYFQLSQGQGCFWRIFNNKKEDILTT
jgi:hypothetical protein